MFFHINKLEEPTTCDTVLKWGSLLLLFSSLLLTIALTFTMQNEDYSFLAENIETMCLNNHT